MTRTINGGFFPLEKEGGVASCDICLNSLDISKLFSASALTGSEILKSLKLLLAMS